MDTATKTGVDASKTTSKWLVQKTTETARDFIGNKIADKIISLDKTKIKQRKMKDRKSTYHQKIESTWLMTWDCFDTI